MTFLSGDKDDFWSLYECLKHRSGEFVPLFYLEKALKNSFLSESFHCQGKQNNNNGVDTHFFLILHDFLDLKLLSTTFHEVCEVCEVILLTVRLSAGPGILNLDPDTRLVHLDMAKTMTTSHHNLNVFGNVLDL